MDTKMTIHPTTAIQAHRIAIVVVIARIQLTISRMNVEQVH